MMESLGSVISPRPAAGRVLRLVVRFCDKKFMVVVPMDATFMDVKNEVLRVYRGISPSVASTNDLSVSELRDYSGCILFDEYQVGLLVEDLTKIVALRPGEEGSCSTISSTPIPSRGCTPSSQGQLLTTPTLSLLHDSSSVKPAGRWSGYPRTTSLDSPSHSPQMSTLGELGDTQMREATSNTCTKVPTESISPIHVATDKGGTQQEDQQTAKASNARKPTDSIAHEDEHSVLRQSYNTSGFDDYRSDDCPVSKDSRSSSSSAEVRSARKRDAYIYISSEEEGSSILIANAKPKIPQKKKKMERSLPKKHGVQRRVEDKTIKKSKLRSNKTTTYREEAGNKRQSSPVLRSRVTLRYPGYSSGWSSSDSETCKDSAILTQTTNGDEKEKSGGKLSAPGSTVSTSSWTSSERENENNQTPSSVIDRQLESGGSVDSQMHQGDDITGSDTPGIDIINVKEQQSQANVLSGLNEQQSQASAVSGPNEQQSEANVVSGLNEQQSQANVVSGLDEQQSQANVVSGLNEQQSQASVLSGLSEQQSQANVLSGLNEQQSQADVISDLNEQSLANNVSHPNQKVSLTDILDKQESPGNSISGLSGQESLLLVSEGNAPSICRVEDIPNTLESTPFASDSVDLEVEAQIENTTGEPQDLGGSVASQLEVTVIPETQEDLTDGLSAEPVVQCPGSPVIPLQNKHPDLLSSLHMPVNMTPVGSGRTKTSCVQPSFSDVDSYVLESVASDTSEDQAKDHMRTELLGKVKKWHSKYMCVHSDVGDSFSMTKSGGGQSCVRRRKAKLISRTFGTSHLNKHPYRRGPFRTNLESRLGLLRSDSEFVHPSPHQLTIACRKRKGLKLRKVRDSAASKTESDDQKNQQREVHLPMRSRHSEDEPLVQVKKPNEADSGISSTNLSEIAQSSGTSTSDTQQNPECHAITKVSKPKKRISREVSISSDSECVEFEPPSFKKRKPRPSFAHQRKQKPSTVDEEYNSDETVIIGVDGFDTTTAEKQISTSLCTPKVDLDSEIPGVSAQQPLIEEHLHLKSSDTTVAEESTTDEYASCSMQHENIGQINCSEQKLQSTTKRVLSTRIGRPSGDDTSESSDSSTSDVDKGVKSIDGVKLSARRELDYGISRKLEYNKDKRCTSVDKLSIDNCSSSNDSVDKTKFQEAPGKAAASLSPPSERSDVVKDGPSSFHSEQKETPRGKMKGVTSPKPAHEIVPLSRVVSAPDESEEDSSDSDDDVDVQKTAQQPIGIEQPRESGGRSVCSSPKKSTLHKTLRSYSTCVHGPPRFLFSKSTLKRNYSQQLSELKNPCLKSQGNSESENSTASDSDGDPWSSSEEENEPPKPKKTGSLQMLIPKGQLRAKIASTAVKSGAQADRSRSQRRFSSDKPVRMFSLTPSIVNKKRNSSVKTITPQSPSVSRKSSTSMSKERASGSEKLGYQESSLSQQEVLLAKGGSQKLSELLTDDKLWEDFKL